jgi:hypothetical protein
LVASAVKFVQESYDGDESVPRVTVSVMYEVIEPLIDP